MYTKEAIAAAAAVLDKAAEYIEHFAHMSGRERKLYPTVSRVRKIAAEMKSKAGAADAPLTL